MSTVSDAFNTAQVLNMLLDHDRRLRALEGKPKVQKESKKIKWQPYFREIMSNGKIWSCYAIEEEMLERWPEKKHLVNQRAIQAALNHMRHQGRIERVGQGNYRLMM